MAKRLTEKLVRELPAPDKGNKIHYDAPDRKGGDWTSGFGLRITASGARSFILNYYVEGRERRLTIGSLSEGWTLKAARAEAVELRRQINAGEDPLAVTQAIRGAPAVKELIARFEAEHLPTLRPSTQRSYASLIKREIAPSIGALKVGAVTHDDIDALHRRITARGCLRHANLCIAVASIMFRFAIRKKMIEKNPCVDCRRNDEVRRERYLSDRELPALLSALDALADRQAADIFRFLLLTGARRGEALSLEWSHIDLEGAVWVKPSTHTKAGRTHRIPLSGPAIELLRRIHDEGVSGPYVFPDRRTGLPRTHADRPWKKIITAAGLVNFRVHDLRHSHASMLVNSGVSLAIIGAALGHSSPAVTSRYAHLQDSSLREATETIGRMIKGAAKS